MTTPPNITELQRFLTIPNLGLFICNLSANNKAGIQWHIQQEKFENLGTEITRASALRYFNSCKKLTMSVIASELAVKSTIMHDYNAIANVCDTFKCSNSKQEIIVHGLPHIPCFKSAGDIFEIRNKQYLLLIDYYSKFNRLQLLSANYSGIQTTTKVKSRHSKYFNHG
uniref:Uncharacterized protein n=1 Tax=Glossina morsitans morsitans TaxID=37546 RepID=A0A1B0GEL6_GLOMM